MISESKPDHVNGSGTANQPGTVLEFVKELEERANDMDVRGWVKEAADLRKWASELRTYLTAQKVFP
jgi:hypothetical protein